MASRVKVRNRGETKERAGAIRVGVGGWTFEPWRGAFYPEDLPRKRELAFAAGRLTVIEINGTWYRAQKPASFARWRDATPDDFMFSVKAPRYATNRRVLADAGETIERFFNGGVMELKHKLGPVNWQFTPTKHFDPDDFAAFLRLLPKRVDGRAIRHAVEARHDSFRSPDFVALAREHGVAIVVAGDSKHPQIADLTADFVYARIMGTEESEPLGYPEPALDLWIERARAWASGTTPPGLESVTGATADGTGRDVWLHVISGHKARNPAAAMALIARLADGAG